MKIKKQDVGVWVKAIDEKPIPHKQYCLRTDGRENVGSYKPEGYFKTVLARYDIKDVEWLKPIEQVYVLTEEELESLLWKAWNYEPKNNYEWQQILKSITK